MSASIDDYFDQRLQELQQWAAAQSDAIARRSTDGEQWMLPEHEGDVLDPLDIEGMGDFFLRDDINTGYTETLSDEESTLADGMAWTLQGDYLAVMERAYRLRQAGRIRRQIWSAARYAGHGNLKGIFRRVIGHVQRVIAMGAPAE